MRGAYDRIPAVMAGRPLVRVLVAAGAGAVLGAAALVGFSQSHRTLTFEMDRDLPPRITSGIYPVESSGEETFAWTADRAEVALPNVSRSVRWTCVARVRAARPP